MGNDPKISIIMSVFNAEKYLAESITSILKQSYTNFELLIIDDKSGDNTLEILTSFEKKDGRIKIIVNDTNKGLTKNLNHLLQIADGDYIARMDADDISINHRFEKQIEFFKFHPDIDILGSYSYNINEEGKVIGERKVPITNEEILKILPVLNPMTHPTVMFRRVAIEKLHGYDEKYRTSQDYSLWFKAAGLGMRFYNIPEFLLKYRMNDKYLSRKSFRYRINEFKIKMNSYPYIQHPWYKYYMAFLSLILAFIPSAIFKFLKRFDPR